MSVLRSWLAFVVVAGAAGIGAALTGGCSNQENSGDVTISVTRSGSGTGTVTSSPSGIDCGSQCTHKFVATGVGGVTVTLTATPDAGSKFDGWSSEVRRPMQGFVSGGCAGTTPTCTFSSLALDQVLITATFTKIPQGCTSDAQCTSPTPRCDTTTGNCVQCLGDSDCGTGSACSANRCGTSCNATAPCAGSCCNGGVCATDTAPTSCGPAGGACFDCSNDPNGRACLDGGTASAACGCNAASDCPIGEACNTRTHSCSNSCGSATTGCNQGCCSSSGLCVAGSTNAQCGSGGSACQDCATASTGHVCRSGVCGCNGPADCADQNACENNQCTTSCSATAPCESSCCKDGTCAVDTAASSCGAPGGACVDCSGDPNGRLCVDGGTVNAKCGCNTATDCPTNAACNTTTHTCSTSCGSGTTACNQGCCSSNGQCVAGTADAQCGNSGASCQDCPTSSVGHACVASPGGGTCGCNGAGDCPDQTACNANQCSTSCSATVPCEGSCCNGGVCAVDTAAATCGASGAICFDCTSNPDGHVCFKGGMAGAACGCNSANDCPTGTACDTATNKCTTSCSATQACNGGCCSSSTGGTCVGGTANNACGSSGNVCADCASDVNGHVCEPIAGGGQCGCTRLADCPALATACTNGTCAYACVINGTTSNCSTGCCDPVSHVCQPGTSSSDCGQPITVCASCGGSTPICLPTRTCGCTQASDCPGGQACVNNVCTTACDSAHPCNAGCCSAASGGTCQTGTQASACGTSGVCANCTSNSTNLACVAGQCGCAVGTDCAPGTACNLGTHQCDTTGTCAGINTYSACNGGCCDVGGTNHCQPGITNALCGTTGGACVGCSNGTPTCAAGICVDNCNAPGNGVCSGGFCCSSLSSGHCVAGLSQTSCGYSGTCMNCLVGMGPGSGFKCETFSPSGPWFCGCDTQTDCPAANPGTGMPGLACGTQAHVCQVNCNVSGATSCNGGCCSSATSGLCLVGTANNACGVSGGTCNDCVNTCSPGPACNPITGACFCTASSQCAGDAACGSRQTCNANACGP